MQHFYQNIDGWFTFPELYKKAVETFNSGSHFVEIGSWLGRSAAFLAVEILNSGKQIKFDCIDTWAGSDEHRYNDVVVNNVLFERFLNNIRPAKEVITPIRKPSLEAVELYDDNSLDFVFIDASHDYENVLKDVKAWYPKVKSGGLFAGHDYVSGWDGVIQAVDEFMLENNYTLDIQSSKENTWGIFKR
jgi:hypothetical protein